MKLLLLLCILLFLGCSNDSAQLNNARFEIDQGNVANARKLLNAIPASSKQKATADSLLKTLEGR